MSARLFFSAALALAAIPTVSPRLTFAQDASTPPEVQNSRFRVEGVVNTTDAPVRSGPGEGYYLTQTLPKGASVTVVGIKFDWLKIIPPDGSFCYVGAKFIDREGNATTGKINRNSINVRAGSLLNAGITTVQTQLNLGDEVQIIGTQDDYLKIKPPTGAYLYINKQYVDVGRMVSGDSAQASAAPTANPQASATTQPSDASAIATETPSIPSTHSPTKAVAMPSIDGGTIAPTASAAPSTQPSKQFAAATTQPAAPQISAEEKFGDFEAHFAQLSKQPLPDQDIQPLVENYQSIAKADDLSDTLKQVVQIRIATLKAREQARTRLIEARKLEKDAAERELALKAENEELQERLDKSRVQVYTAVGCLQPSSLQTGGGTLYRLTDPATGRTVIYLRTSDPKITGLMGQFVGVSGEPTTDPQLSLRVIAPTDVEQVDPNQVNSQVAAEIIPPSFLARQASASANP